MFKLILVEYPAKIGKIFGKSLRISRLGIESINRRMDTTSLMMRIFTSTAVCNLNTELSVKA